MVVMVVHHCEYNFNATLNCTLKNGYGPGTRFMPIIPTLWEAEEGDHLRSGVRDQPGQHGETSSLLKIQKLARRGGMHL